jgi:chromosome segregation ATPase
MSTEALEAIVPWTCFGVMFLFGAFFAVVSLLARKRAGELEDKANGIQMALAQMEARAYAAESRIAAAEQRAQLAEQRIAHAEERTAKAKDAAKDAESRKAEAERSAQQALDEARRADSALQQRKSAAEEKARQSEQRARGLLEWARQQWEARREPDRQQAQGQQGSFQAQLDAFLELRRAPVSFRVESEVDRMAAALLPRFAQQEHVEVQGESVTVRFPVDASLGFRA